MKVFGYIERTCNPHGLVELAQMTFQASPATCRQIADFFFRLPKRWSAWTIDSGTNAIPDELEDWLDKNPKSANVSVAD